MHYVDAYKLFSGTDGEYSGDLADETGKVVTMRGGDGVHFTRTAPTTWRAPCTSSSTRSAA